MLRPYTDGRRTPGNAGHDGHRVSRLDGRVALRQLADVAIVHVYVDKATQASILGEQVTLEPGVLAGKLLQQLAHVSPFQLEHVATAHVGAQRRGNQYGDCHTAFRSSMVMDSSANVPRSSARTQLLGSPARPAPTPTRTYESNGHARTRTNASVAVGAVRRGEPKSWVRARDSSTGHTAALQS